MATDTLEARDDSAKTHSPEAIQILDELAPIATVAALLRACVDMGSGPTFAQLLEVAFQHSQKLERRYLELCGVQREPE